MELIVNKLRCNLKYTKLNCSSSIRYIRRKVANLDFERNQKCFEFCLLTTKVVKSISFFNIIFTNCVKNVGNSFEFKGKFNKELVTRFKMFSIQIICESIEHDEYYTQTIHYRWGTNLSFRMNTMRNRMELALLIIATCRVK